MIIRQSKSPYHDENGNYNCHTYNPIAREFLWFPTRTGDEMGDGDSHSFDPIGGGLSWFLTLAVAVEETKGQGDDYSSG